MEYRNEEFERMLKTVIAGDYIQKSEQAMAILRILALADEGQQRFKLRLQFFHACASRHEIVLFARGFKIAGIRAQCTAAHAGRPAFNAVGEPRGIFPVACSDVRFQHPEHVRQFAHKLAQDHA